MIDTANYGKALYELSAENGTQEQVREELETVRQAGRAYASDGTVDAETMAKLAVPMIPEDVYARICSGQPD